MRQERTGNPAIDRVLSSLRDEIASLKRGISNNVSRVDKDTNRLIVGTPDGKASVQIDVDDGSWATPLRRDIDGRGLAIRNLKSIEVEELKSAKGTVRIGNDISISGDGSRAQLLCRDISGNILVENDPTANPVFDTITANSMALSTSSFGGATDFAEFEADGTLHLNGNATYWRDLDFPIIIRTTGANIPTITAINSSVITAPMWQVNDYNMCEGQELPHEWKLGTDGTWHIHVITAEDLGLTSRYLKFKIEYVWAGYNSVLSSLVTTTSVELEVPAGTAKYTHLIFNIGTFSHPTAGLATHVWPRLTRLATIGAAAADPWVTMLQMHIECDTLGSRGIITK